MSVQSEVQVETSTVVVGALGDWAAAWDKLVEWAPVPSPFLRSWWLAAVATDAARYVLIVEDGQLVGGLALQIHRRVLGVTVYRSCADGALCPDHLDMLAVPGRELDVCHALLEWFTGPGARLLDLDGVVQNSLVAATFPPSAATVIGEAPWDFLPDSGAAYLAARSANLRRLHRRSVERFAALGIEHRRPGPHEIDGALDEFERMHRARPDRAWLLAEMPRLRPALRAGCAAGEVQIDVFRTPDRTVAVEISFRIAGALRMYQSARSLDRDMRDIGTVVLLEVLRVASDEGCHEADLLRGTEAYKFRFADRRRRLYRVQVAHGMRAQALLAMLRWAGRARGAAGRVRRRIRPAGRRSDQVGP
jgi:CelD/BcsL family acetyltransferase involved in cellulose biosynthesis